MKRKVIIAGIGELFWEIKGAIEEEYTIVALADNITKAKSVGGYPKISIDEVKQFEYDYILICAKLHKELLRDALIHAGVPESKIRDARDIESLLYRKDKERYEKDKAEYIEKYALDGMGSFEFSSKDEYAFLTDYRENAGRVDGHYFYMDILVAKKILENNPEHHYDIGSRIEGLISHLIAMDIDTTMIDIRPLPVKNAGCGIAKLDFIQGDATNLETIEDNSIESLSSLHAVEHFGLGRYGDTVNPNACFAAMHSMGRVLKQGGYLYFGVPVGKTEKVCFNAHRIFYPDTVVKSFQELTLVNMYLIHNMEMSAYTPDEVKCEKYGGIIGDYDCGIFIFTK